MATVYQEYLGQFAISTSEDSFTVGTSPCALPTGRYYLYGYTGETAQQLLETLQAVIRNSTSFTGANVSYCYDSAAAVNSYVNISLGAAATNMTVQFNDTGLATILGFTSSVSANAQTHCGQRKPRFVWRPTNPPSEADTTPEELFAPVGTSKVYRAEDGTLTSVDGVTVLYDARRLAYQALPQNDAIRNAAAPDYRSWQEFWEDVIARGRPVRILPDRSTVANSACVITAAWGAETPGAFADSASKTMAPYLGYWDLRMTWWKGT